MKAFLERAKGALLHWMEDAEAIILVLALVAFMVLMMWAASERSKDIAEKVMGPALQREAERNKAE